MKMKAYESYSDWEKEESETNKLTADVSKYVQSVASHLERTVKWGQGCFLKDGEPVIFIHTEPDHVQLGFYHGSALDDPNQVLEGKGKYVRHIKLISEDDIQDKDAIFFVNQVI